MTLIEQLETLRESVRELLVKSDDHYDMWKRAQDVYRQIEIIIERVNRGNTEN